MFRITRWCNVVILAGFFWGCADSGSPELAQAVNAIRYLSAPTQLSRSAFAAAFAEEEGKPSQYVSYLFSQLGTAAGIPLIPENVFLAPLEPDLEVKSKLQLVVRFDDERGVIIVDGYTNPAQKPLFTQEWPLPKVSPAPGVQELFESQVETGASYQAF
jgi:hypothetical protein